MKINHCTIYQFGKLKDKDFSFSEGITLIRGRNESGKTTLHTALAALLFGAEKGRGRAAKDSIYQAGLPWENPRVYGGLIEWEREGRLIRTERDFSKTPTRSFYTEKTPEGPRELNADRLPWPASLSPALFFNTLSFRQRKAGMESGLADELRSHIINLQSSGDESIDLASARAGLKEKRRGLEKQLDREAEGRAVLAEQQLAQLESLSFASDSSGWDENKVRLARQEEEARRLSEERSRLSRALKERRSLLEQHGLDQQEEVRRDAERASVLSEAMRNYEESYAPTSPSPWIIRLLTWLTLPLMLLFFWLVVNALQMHRYPTAVLSALGFFIALFVSIRFSRKQDAADAQRHNLKVLRQLLEKYLPDYTPEGNMQEARELSAYLDNVVETYDYLADQDRAVRKKTEDLAQLLGENQSISRNLKEDLDRRMERERWEMRIKSLMDEQEALKPLLEKNQLLREEIRALSLAEETLASLAERSFSDYGVPLTEEASRIFREITEGRYQGVRVSRDLELLAEQDHQLIPPGALSAGAMEQLYFSFRLALVRLLWPQEPMPLFFDDSFAYYDTQRLGALLSWLSEHYEGQVFLFSCQDREEALLKEKGIPYHKILLEAE